MNRSPELAVAAVVLAAAAAVIPLTAASAAANPIGSTTGFLVDPDSVPNTWVAQHPTDARAATIKAEIGDYPIAKWFTGSSGPTIGQAVGAYVGRGANARKLPVLVAYNLPGRDACGGHSSGGAASDAAYRSWIAAFADSIGSRPAVVILEPDAFGDYSCMTPAQIAARNTLLNFAVSQFASRATNTWAYLDAGNAGWVAPATMAGYLREAGVSAVRGFAVNVANYYTTAASISYANKVNAALGGAKPYVVDTSRNGNGSNGQWCNPAGRKLGSRPQVGGGAEMLLWVKTVGTSDGLCGTAPATPAGTFDPGLAMRLINGT
ncbi:glycoside hydrolase family 6 protein [Paractinoplanes lichenicola]|uniref:Glucanase n=1 Tax=Paractinoplanes lichenicola TaxID=2802976 RepID=A0ABS1W339_9ACTN|nr:glycoside hydrolase family 6 protein [Actinoplanes lichenicola]MBL7261156.1 glycoside hydrolase family 6 protein [Actinoplanes lichenicola]